MPSNTMMLVFVGILAGVMLAMVAVEFAAVYFVKKGKRNGK